MDDLEAELDGLAAEAAIEAELVPLRRKQAHSFTEVMVDARRHGPLSSRESKFLIVILKTGNVTAASQEIGITPATGYKYLKRPHIREYVDRMRERSAKALDLTVDKVAATLNDAIEGKEITPIQLQAAGMAARMLTPTKGPSVVVNQQNNYNGVSPFANLEQGAMLDEIKKNLLEMGG